MGQNYYYELGASDPFVAASRLEYSLVAGPDGMALVDDELRWTPGEAQLGGHEIVIRVTDPYGLSDTQNFTINVSPLVRLDQVPEGQSRIPRTGARITRYAGDDGALRVGTDRFFVRDDDRDVVVDQVNGLVWQDSSDVISGELKSYYQASVYCSNLEHGGIDNWRIPNRLELIYLLDHSQTAIEQVFKYQLGQGVGREWFFAAPQLQGRQRQNGIRHWRLMVSFDRTTILPSDDSKTASVRCVSGEQQFCHHCTASPATTLWLTAPTT